MRAKSCRQIKTLPIPELKEIIERTNMNLKIESCLTLLGRILLSLIFILSGFGKIGDWSGTASYMASKRDGRHSVLSPDGHSFGGRCPPIIHGRVVPHSEAAPAGAI